MRYASWALGIAGILQYAAIVAMGSTDYVSVDMAYLVMWLAIMGGLLLCYMSCWGGCGYGCGYGGSDDCNCCGDNCNCGDCGSCGPAGGKREAAHSEHSHEGHSH